MAMRTDVSVPYPSSKVHVINIRPVQRGNLKAFCDVRLGGILVKDFRVIQQPGQRPWTSPPQREWTDANGQTRYAPVVELTDRLKQQVQQAILEAWEGGAA